MFSNTSAICELFMPFSQSPNSIVYGLAAKLRQVNDGNFITVRVCQNSVLTAANFDWPKNNLTTPLLIIVAEFFHILNGKTVSLSANLYPIMLRSSSVHARLSFSTCS